MMSDDSEERAKVSVNTPLLGGIVGALLGVVWLVFGLGPLLLVGSLAALGFGVGLVIDRPDRLIALLERLRDR